MPDDLAARARKRAEECELALYRTDAALYRALADRVDEQERRIKELKSRIEELDNLERQNRQKFGRQLRRLDAIGAKLSLANWHLYKTWEQTGTCLCGARKESPDTHPHTSSCPTADAIREWHETEALSQKGGE